MKDESVKILQDARDSILSQWMQKQDFEDSFLSSDDQKEESDEVLTALLDGLGKGDSSEKITDIVMSVQLSRARRGFTPRETALYIFKLKETLLETLKANINDPVVLYTDSLYISNLIDNLAIVTFESFIKGREDVILRQTDEIAEISTPVIRVWDGVVALPIIGTLDSSRTQVVMENLLQQIVDTGSSIAILDISGVPAVDSLVAQHLIKTVSATRLLGAECIISGIRPEIAQIVVHLGIDLSNIITKASLASALKTAFNMLQLEVHKKRLVTNTL